MTRDSRPGSGVRANPRGGRATFEPNRSSLRRVGGRRGGRADARSLPPKTEPATPRNLRVVRTPPRERGPSLSVRAFRRVSGGARASYGFVARGTRALSTRLSTPARGRAGMVLQLLGACLFAAGAIWLGRFVQHHLTTAPAFTVDAIDVRGTRRMTRAELLSAAGVDLGINVFTRKPEEVRARLLSHPWILAAQVSRKLPSRFEIEVQEREPVALLVVEACGEPPDGAGVDGHDEADDPSCEGASTLYLVSEDGKLFKRPSGKDPIDVPVITGVTRRRFATDPELPQRVLGTAIALLRDYRESGLGTRQPIGEVHVEADDGFSLYVGEDLTFVRLGAPPFGQKLRRMKKVFERLEREHARAEYIYLDNEQRPDRVAVRLR